jgi:hypothetical protein
MEKDADAKVRRSAEAIKAADALLVTARAERHDNLVGAEGGADSPKSEVRSLESEV